jgi:hypothetical protein
VLSRAIDDSDKFVLKTGKKSLCTHLFCSRSGSFIDVLVLANAPAPEAARTCFQCRALSWTSQFEGCSCIVIGMRLRLVVLLAEPLMLLLIQVSVCNRLQYEDVNCASFAACCLEMKA